MTETVGGAGPQEPVAGEFEALVRRLRGAARTVWRRRGLALASAWAVAVAGAGLVWMVPERHEASARLVVDTHSALKPLISGMTVQSAEAERQARVLAKKVVASPQLERLLERGDLGWAIATPTQREDTLVKLIARTKLTTDENGIHTVSFRDTDPERARRVVEALVELFNEVAEGEKQRDLRDANRFLQEQTRASEARVFEAERRLTEFKVRYFGATGVAKEDYFARIASMQEAIARLRAELAAAEQTRDAYRAELGREDPQRPVDVEVTARRKSLDDMLIRLGEQHPDVVAARETIARLESQRREVEPEPTRAGSPTNPVYQRLRSQLAEAEALVAALRSRLGVTQQRLAEVRTAADRAPEVEAELAQLTLEAEFARKTYDQLVAKGESAAFGLRADESTRAAEFRVIEPARAGGSPVFPGHLELALAVVLASLAAGVAVPLAAQALRPVFEDAVELARATGRPVLGEIRAWPANLEAVRGRGWFPAVAAAALLAAQATWLAWIQRGG